MSKVSPTLLLALASACGGLKVYAPATSETDAPAVDSDTPEPSFDTGYEATVGAQPVLEGISPAFGTTAGGSEVRITGRELADVHTVRIGGREATIVSTSATEIIARAPTASGAGWVAAEVESDTGLDQLARAFQYWQDGAGLVGGQLTLERMKMVGGYWTSPPDPVAWASARFFQPVDMAFWQQFTGSFDTCERNWAWPFDLVDYSLAAPELRLAAGAQSLVLTPSDDDPDIYETAYLPVAQVPTSRLYSLDPITSADFPTFGLADVVGATGTFDVTTPGIGRASMPTVDRTIDLAWSGSGGDYVVILLLYISVPASGTPSVSQVVSCATHDDGAFTVPRAVWDGWATRYDDYLEVRVARVKEVFQPLPHDGSNLDVVSTAWVFGAAWME
jgi:hypothetical protein